MKKFFGVFLAMAIVIMFSSNTAQSADLKNFFKTVKELTEQVVEHENDVELRDFPFLYKISLIQLKNWNEAIEKGKNSKEDMNEINKVFYGTILIQYSTLQCYLKECVIEKNKDPRATRQKYDKLIDLVDQAVLSLK